MKIIKKEYCAHCNTKFNTTPSNLGETYILKLNFSEWLNLYIEDKDHWYDIEKYDSNFQTFKYNPVYSVPIEGTKDGLQIIYRDFCIIFSSFKDYKLYKKFLTTKISNNIIKEKIKSTVFEYKNTSNESCILQATGIRANVIIK